jgi:hypothetical protein
MLSTQSLYAFHFVLRINRKTFPKPHYKTVMWCDFFAVRAELLNIIQATLEDDCLLANRPDDGGSKHL